MRNLGGIFCFRYTDCWLAGFTRHRTNAKGDFVSLLFRSKISKWLFRQCIHHDLGLRIGENSTFCCASNAGRA